MTQAPPGTAAWQFWIDRGGTFTDIVARHPGGSLTTHKFLSADRDTAGDPVVAAIKAVMAVPSGEPLPHGRIAAVRMGTTVATKALLQRRGERVLLLVNQGFADALRIGNQARPRLFDLAITLPTPLYETVAEVGGRIGADGAEIAPLDEHAARIALREAASSGIRACAIALMHAWKYPEHERRLAELARGEGYTQISASHEVSPLLRLIPRAQTTVLDAYLSPVLRRSMQRMAGELGDTRLYFMQSNGGLADAASFRGKDAVLSGPAGGIVGAVRTAEAAGFDRVITFDMGGTSTDVALYAGAFEHRFETVVAGVQVQAPMLAINTVAAGGGSVLHFGRDRLRVGPDSAAADPGPAAYRRGGPLTMTDANICVGKIQAAHFPSIFGPDGDQPLDAGAVRDGFAALAQDIAQAGGGQQEARDIAEGFLRVGVANMANAIRQVSVQRGYDPGGFVLQCFGGAGGQHACLVAAELGIDTVLIHPFAGVLSAYGMGLADQVVLRDVAVEQPLDAALLPALHAQAQVLEGEARAALLAQCADAGGLAVSRSLHLRYEGSEAALIVKLASVQDMQEAFTASHLARFGFATAGRPIVVAMMEVEARQPGPQVVEQHFASRESGLPEAAGAVEIWSGGRAHAAPVFDRASLLAGDEVSGPALVREANATTVWTARITPQGDMLLRRDGRTGGRANAIPGARDPVLVEIFANLFMNVAEQAGAVLCNTATSVNIRERLDFSCAIFDGEGCLVANAPHVPVHLGAMGESVKAVLRQRGATLKPGDVIALNDPANGGTHLPDITVITPVFGPDGAALRFFVACRGHHADIGGTTPGSTPPDSRTLEEEGVVINDFLLAQCGMFREAEFRALLAGARYPARSPDANVADIKAQIASNTKAMRALNEAVAWHGWETVRTYMGHVMNDAEESVRRVIATLHDGSADYRMDDGGSLRVAVRVDRERRSAVIDFTGTDAQRADNFNAPPAVTRAVVLYVFRCLAGGDIPLNDGCMKPIEVIIPPGTFLSPAAGAAVVAGNTEVSQAVCNALFAALGTMACSQGTMNNFLFGDATRQYYETICGGAGAGAEFEGQSAVHTHMTNTRMTDPELLELRYPVRLEEFSIRRGSGGAGHNRGGDGAVRRLRFLEKMTAVIVASNRKAAPFGLAGGGDGAPGAQWIDRADGTRTPLSGCDRAQLAPGDVVTIYTPSGGGYGT